jgi:PIN domain nuclease of toxin-antitoxin system
LRVLIDTHLALWGVTTDDKLPLRARELMLAPENTVFVSVASLWEIAIKFQLQRGNRNDVRLSAADAAAEFEAAGFNLLPITAEHTIAVGRLPRLHADPFDRMLVAQARSEPLRLVTSDRRVAAYGDAVELV